MKNEELVLCDDEILIRINDERKAFQSKLSQSNIFCDAKKKLVWQKEKVIWIQQDEKFDIRSCYTKNNSHLFSINVKKMVAKN